MSSINSINLSTKLDPDETRVLAECERESLIYRSIPLGLLNFFAIQFAMSKNVISTKAKWFKFGGSLFAGYIIGKVLYAPTCRKKVLAQIPNSNIARTIRGVEALQSSDMDINTHPQTPPKDSSEAGILIPEPDHHTTPVSVNQYGDPIYETNK